MSALPTDENNTVLKCGFTIPLGLGAPGRAPPRSGTCKADPCLVSVAKRSGASWSFAAAPLSSLKVQTAQARLWSCQTGLDDLADPQAESLRATTQQLRD